MHKKKSLPQSIRSGLGFGLTSGVITTLGLIVGLDVGTGSRLAVIGGIVTIAIADACSDALGMHVSQESDVKNTQRGVWESTFTTFIAKFLVALSFLIPVLMLPLQQAVLVCIAFGVLLLSAFSYYIAKRNGESALHTIFEHLVIAGVVLAATAFVGSWIPVLFGP